jgi:hypothetical protein
MQSSQCGKLNQGYDDIHDDETDKIRGIKDILGPLPQVPSEFKTNISQRSSTVSGIYEEILDSPTARLVFSILKAAQKIN